MRSIKLNAWCETLRYRVKVAHTFFQAWIHRKRLAHVCLIGITGSAGKTSTKDLVQLLLSNFHQVSGTLKSLNIAMAVAETILRIERQDSFCVLEISASKPHALDLPVRLFKPKIGVLTVIGDDHYQAFRGAGIEGIAAEKGKLITGLPRDGTAVLNIDDPRVKAIGERAPCHVIWVGTAEGATIRLLSATSCWPEPLKLMITFQGQEYEVLTQLHGTHLALSVLAALGVSIAAGIPLSDAIPILGRATPPEGRMQIVTDDKGVVFIRDDMKAPLWSLQAPLEFLKQAAAPRKIAIIGTISYFSQAKSEVYRSIAKRLEEYADLIIFVGPDSPFALPTDENEQHQSLLSFPNIRDASTFLKKELRKGDLVLLKGSNKASHLARLILDRTKDVQCWQQDCGLDIFCIDCKNLYASAPETTRSDYKN